jgi:tRNA (guanine-N7-)-methyltransferase
VRTTRPLEHESLISQRRDELRAALTGIVTAESRLVWEVGSGHGHFLTAYAKAHPAETCVGVDIMSDRVVRAHRKRERAQLANLHFVRADSADFLAVLPEGARFTSVFILFPDPWPKRRHHKNRVLNAAFLTDVASRAGQGAPLHFRTDHAPYFAAASSMIRGHADWETLEDPSIGFEEPTVFEKRARGHFTLVARRR